MSSQQRSEISTDKRDVAETFRDRMALLIARKGMNLSQFSDSIGVDRSALSQFLTPGSTRLPRAETLCAIARSSGVSLDWLMGMIASDAPQDDAAPTLEMEPISNHEASDKLARWHREAMGYKIRYVPTTLPDLLRTEAVGAYEFRDYNDGIKEARGQQAADQLTYSRRPETDLEVCMPVQTLEQLAKGEGVWSELPAQERRHQLETMAELIDELYPTFRLFLFDQRERHVSPYTLFGPKRAALYIGKLYMVINSVEHIRALIYHFDTLIRIAKIGPDRAAAKIRQYL